MGVSSSLRSGDRRPMAAAAHRKDPHLRVVLRRLTPRDRSLVSVLFDHQVLTTAQVTDLCFASVVTARHRLAALCVMGVLDRFRPFRPVGSAPWHYVLDTLGVEIAAAERGIEVSRPQLRHARALQLMGSQRLEHLVGINGFFSSLAHWARSHDGELAAWWPERRCRAEWGEVVRPDGYGVVRQGTRVVECLVEYDRGTETLARLRDKLAGYGDLVRATGWSPLVCFWFPSAGREAHARSVLREGEVRVVTASADLGGPGDPVWLPAGSEGPRCRLIELAPAGGRL